MIKYGVESSEILEYCIRQIKSGAMSYDEAIAKCKKHGMYLSKDDIQGYM